jgi:hypothetical protein
MFDGIAAEIDDPITRAVLFVTLKTETSRMWNSCELCGGEKKGITRFCSALFRSRKVRATLP